MSLLEQYQKIGYYPDVPEQIYHSNDFPGVSASKLNLIRRSFYHYDYSLTHKKDTSALFFGRAFHCAILTPDLFKDLYVIEPKFDRRTTKGKEAAAEFEKQNSGKELISAADYETLKGMSEECFKNAAVSCMLREGMRELTMVWQHEDILCKGRTDLIRPNDGIILDFKTTENCTPKSFKKDLAKYFYDRSAAFYLDGATQVFGKEFKTFAYVVIEKEPPYDLGLYVLDQETIKTGRRIYNEDLQRYHEYIAATDKNIFKSKEFSLIGLPDWAHNTELR